MGLPLNIDVVQILLHALNLVILVGALTLILYRPVCRFLRDRRAYYEKKEQDNKEQAEACARLKAAYEAKLAEAEETAQKVRAAAEKDAGEAAARVMEEARAKAAAILSAAEQDARARKEQILESSQSEISELVLSAAQKLMTENATPESDRALYDAFLKEAAQENSQGEDNA